MNAKVVDLAPHEWCEISSSSDIGLNRRTRAGHDRLFRCAVAVVSAGVGFYLSIDSDARSSAAGAKHRTISIISKRTPASQSPRVADRHAPPRELAKSRPASDMRAGAAESEKTRWEMAGWAVRR